MNIIIIKERKAFRMGLNVKKVVIAIFFKLKNLKLLNVQKSRD